MDKVWFSRVEDSRGCRVRRRSTWAVSTCYLMMFTSKLVHAASEQIQTAIVAAMWIVESSINTLGLEGRWHFGFSLWDLQLSWSCTARTARLDLRIVFHRISHPVTRATVAAIAHPLLVAVATGGLVRLTEWTFEILQKHSDRSLIVCCGLVLAHFGLLTNLLTKAQYVLHSRSDNIDNIIYTYIDSELTILCWTKGSKTNNSCSLKKKTF